MAEAKKIGHNALNIQFVIYGQGLTPNVLSLVNFKFSCILKNPKSLLVQISTHLLQIFTLAKKLNIR